MYVALLLFDYMNMILFSESSDDIVFTHASYLPGRVIGGGLVMVQLRGTLGLFSNEAIKLR